MMIGRQKRLFASFVMLGSRHVIYWDACCFVYLLNGDPLRGAALGHVYANAQAGQILLVTSTFSIVEVNHVVTEQLGAPPDPATEAGIDRFWNDRTSLQFIEFDFFVARTARTLIRDLRAKATNKDEVPSNGDAVHLASAMTRSRALATRRGAGGSIDEIQTYDGRWQGTFQPVVGIDIAEPTTLYGR